MKLNASILARDLALRQGGTLDEVADLGDGLKRHAGDRHALNL
jgi:hypothetical protein